MAHWALGTTTLAGGGLLAAVAPVAGGAAGVYLLVVGIVLIPTGVGLLLARGGRRHPATREEELHGSLAAIEREVAGSPRRLLLQQAFAVTHDEDGELCAVDRLEVDAVFQRLLLRWRGPLGLAMARLDEDPEARLSGGFDRAATELRSDILQMERYLDGLLFRDPASRLPYAEILAELDALLHRLEGGHRGRPPGR